MLQKYSYLLLITLAIFTHKTLQANEALALDYLNSANWGVVIDAQLKAQIEAAVAQNPSQQQQIITYYTKIMSWAAIKPDLIKVISNTFTDAELVELIRFYQTPTGQKLAGMSSEINQQLLAIINNNSKIFMAAQQIDAQNKVKVSDCTSETSDIGPDVAYIGSLNSGFTLVVSRNAKASDYLKVYYDDKEILTPSRAKAVLAELATTENRLKGRQLACFNRIVTALKLAENNAK
ncbi:MAG: DUF2059 domain-containing protein [Algicola sp.]|nr:DUF2059 domain-containing protein [Algicola sp.]